MSGTCTCCPVHNDIGRALNAIITKATAASGVVPVGAPDGTPQGFSSGT